MTKNRFYREFTYQEINYGNNFMMSEMMNLDFMHPVRSLHMRAWQDFKDNKFSYDGATFVRERSDETIFELASFIHDPFHRQLLKDTEEQRTWCVVRYSSSIRRYASFINIFHFIVKSLKQF